MWARKVFLSLLLVGTLLGLSQGASDPKDGDNGTPNVPKEERNFGLQEMTLIQTKIAYTTTTLPLLCLTDGGDAPACTIAVCPRRKRDACPAPAKKRKSLIIGEEDEVLVHKAALLDASISGVKEEPSSSSLDAQKQAKKFTVWRTSNVFLTLTKVVTDTLTTVGISSVCFIEGTGAINLAPC